MNENNVPAGFVLVPREPTREMMAAAHEADCATTRSWGALRDELWRAMVAAAPSAPVAQPPATAEVVVPTMQQVSDYLHGLDSIQRQLVEREARALATQSPAPVPCATAVDLPADMAKVLSENAWSLMSEEPPAPLQQTEWKTPPASWRLLAKAAINLLCAIDEKHDRQSPPLKYAIPYGAVNDLRVALGGATPPAPATALPPVARVPLTEEHIDALPKPDFTYSLQQVFRRFARTVERAHGIEASTGEQS